MKQLLEEYYILCSKILKNKNQNNNKTDQKGYNSLWINYIKVKDLLSSWTQYSKLKKNLNKEKTISNFTDAIEAIKTLLLTEDLKDRELLELTSTSLKIISSLREEVDQWGC